MHERLRRSGPGPGEPVPSSPTPAPQSTLVVGGTTDAAEVEAHRIADEVMRRLAGGTGDGGNEGASAEGAPVAGRIRRSSAASAASSAAGADGGPVDTVTESKIRASGAGRPLDAASQSRFEHAFGADFSAVRIHTNSEAAPMIGATAFTLGSHIHLAPNAYEPASARGQRVLAHELTHVLQGDGSARRQTAIRRLGGPALNLMEISDHYDTETVTQRADLAGVIGGCADWVFRLKRCIEAMTTAADDAQVNAAIDGLSAPVAQTTTLAVPANLLLKPDDLKLLLRNKPKDQALALVSTRHRNFLAKCNKQEFPFGENGVMDVAALNARIVQYDTTPEAQAKSLVTISGGRLKRSATHARAGADVDTADSVTHFSGVGWEIFVVGADGDLHMASHKVGKFHHSSLLGGAAVSMAGELKVQGGVIQTMSNKSGHYSPTAQAFIRYLRVLQNQSVPLTFNVQGFGVPPGQTAQQWMQTTENAEATGTAGPDDPKTPERFDVETAWESYVADSKNPMQYCTDPAPAGLGWRVGRGTFEREVTDASGTRWEPVSHDAVRAALAAKWGPPKKKVRKKVGDPQHDRIVWR